jgi:hypothetical protein
MTDFDGKDTTNGKERKFAATLFLLSVCVPVIYDIEKESLYLVLESAIRGGRRACRRHATRCQAQLTPYQRRSRAVW